jgi:DNA-binding CsgD family transcriptional regulator
MLTRLRTATVDPVVARTAAPPAGPAPMRHVQQALTPLCIIAAGAAFVAEAREGSATAISALAVVPVLVASMLRSRMLTVTVVSFAVALQLWGVTAGFVDRDAAGMQIAVYLLVLAVATLQQSRLQQSITAEAAEAVATLREGDDIADMLPDSLVDTVPVASNVIRVTGVQSGALHSSGSLLPEIVARLLTRRERDVVILAVHGFTAREIGARLFIGERTVETHLANAYGKLGVRSKLEMVRAVSSAAERADIRTRTEASEQVSA